MKGLLLLLIGLCSVMNSYAMCAFDGLFVFPKETNIKQNTLFVLEGFAFSQDVILKLNTSKSAYLQNGEERIKLIVLDVCEGQYDLTQAILKPEYELKVGVEYTMYVENLSSENYFGRQVAAGSREMIKRYTVLEDNDVVAPKVDGYPKVISKTYRELGCGPEKFVVFSNPVKDESELLVKTTVRGLDEGDIHVYYLTVSDNKIKIGHDMCAGAFTFTEGDNYEVEFVFMDSAGNIADTKVDKIKFTKPKSNVQLNLRSLQFWPIISIDHD